MQAPELSQLFSPQRLLQQFIKGSTLYCEAGIGMGLSLLTFTAIVPVLPLLLGLGMTGDVQVRTIVVEDQIIMRIPVRPQPPQVDWVEHKGPKCIASKKIQGAFLSGDDHVDFVLEGRKLLRAEFDDTCPALDFYNGFYLSSSDEKVCARRDVVRSRMGGSCMIDHFRELEPKLRR